MEIIDIVNKKLQDMGVSNISDTIKKHLYKIEELISAKDSELNGLSKKMHDCDYDVKSIAEQVGLARATFYNNPYAEIERLKQIIQEQKDTISLFEQRDCNMMLLEEKNQQQAKIIQEQNDTIERLKKMKIMKFSK